MYNDEKSRKKNILVKLMILAMSMVFIFGFVAVPASAASSSSIPKTVYGTTYTFYSQLHRLTSDFQFGVHVDVNKTVGAGYVGAKNRLYTSDGTLASSSDWMYNSSSISSGHSFASFYTPATNQYYYSKGEVQFYNGNGYTTYTCNATQNLDMLANINVEVQRNKSGEIFGSELFLNQIGIEPDLIKAVNEDGVVGYVKSLDLDKPSVGSPEEALLYKKEIQKYREIPLYAEDGETILGKYIVDNTSRLK